MNLFILHVYKRIKRFRAKTFSILVIFNQMSENSSIMKPCKKKFNLIERALFPYPMRIVNFSLFWSYVFWPYFGP